MPCSECFGGKVSHTGPIKLNVGGQTFTTSRQTVQKCPKLNELLAQKPGADGFYFIDRDGRYFAEILTFCRDGPDLFVPPTDETARRILKHEAAFFGLLDLADAVKDTYTGAKIPANEAKRLATLDGLNILHTNEHEHHYDSITQLVAAVLDVPICLVSLVHTDHQWFKSRVGLEANQTSRNSSFCAMTFMPEDPKAAQMLVIEDAKSDGRTASNPLVLGEPHIGFYAGCPIVTADGSRLGALCAIDHVPRSISSAQAQVLVNLAQLTAQEIQHEQLLNNDSLSEEGEPENIPSVGDFAAGPLRAERMREALHEAVVLCKVRLDSGDWPLLYGSRYFTEISGIFLTPPHRLSGRATASGKGMRYLRGAKTQEIGLWDWLHLSGKGEKQLRADVKTSFEQAEAGMFALQAMAPVMSSSVHNSRGSGTDRVRVSCRFMPCELPIDVAAQSIRPVPQRDTSKPGEHHLANFGGNDRLYFVSITVVGDATKAHYSSSASSTPTGNSSFSRLHSPFGSEKGLGLDQTPPVAKNEKRKTTGKAVEAMKPARSPFQDVRLVRLVGQGSFGKVFYALWMGSTVAVKIIESKVSDKMKKFQPVFEAALSASISHPNLVQTFHYSTRAKPKEEHMEDSPDEIMETWMVQEWCDLGTLGCLCKKLWEAKDPLADIIDICGDISRAGSYLHARGIIHGDLTANNVLIKTQVSRKGYICKIADFGLARVLEGNNVDILTTQIGTVTHMPPELFEVTKEVKLTTKADIYAMAMLMYQLFAGEPPYPGLSAPQVIVQVVKGKKVKLPNTAPESLHEVFERCTAANPKDRPTFDELVLIFGGQMTQIIQNDGAGSPSNQA